MVAGAEGAVRIAVVPGGPLQVRGDLSQVELSGPEGAPVDLTGRRSVLLCRCGRSETSPLCDGSHARKAAEDGAGEEGA